MIRIFIITVTLYLLLIPNVTAQTNNYEYSAESKVLLKQLEDEIVGTFLAVIENERRAGKGFVDFNYLLSIPAKNYVEFGLLIDTTDFKNGFKVVSLTKGGAAEKAGIKLHDVIVEFNGVKVADYKGSDQIRELWDIKPNEALQLGVMSEGSYINVSSIVPSSSLPEIKLAVGGNKFISNQSSTKGECGSVSVVSTIPKELGLAYVSIKKIDDHNINTKQPIKKLSAGKHKLTFSLGQKNMAMWGGGKREIEIDIKPNIRYFFAAKASQLKQSPYGGGAKWKPVIWQTKAIDCD
jgi:hypothetical protein